MRTDAPTKPQTATEIVDNIQAPDYLRHRQPTYAPEDRDAVIQAVAELLNMQGIATSESIDAVQVQLSEIVEGIRNEVVIVTGRCAQPVVSRANVSELVQQQIRALEICIAGLGKPVLMLARNCTAKPRSAPKQTLRNGQEVPPHMGDEINGVAVVDREPTPDRMVQAAVQDRDIRIGLALAGKNIPSAKEALLLPSLKAMIRSDPVTGKHYYAGAEVPWLGERTRQKDGEHLLVLSGLENPIGVKLSHKTTADEIQAYKEKLNPSSNTYPSGRPGKLIFMLRFGLAHMNELDKTLAAIKKFAPSAMILYDIHGSTVLGANGEKIRNVSSIIEEIYTIADRCNKAGLRLHGLHVESIMENDAITGKERLECVDYEAQIPTHEGGVDPQLNQRQLLYLLGAVKKAFRPAA